MELESHDQGSSRVSIKHLVQYLVTVALLMNAIGLTVHSVLSGAIMGLTALLTLPQVRDRVESVSPIEFRPVVTVGVLAGLIVIAGVVLLPAVDLGQAPDFLVPFQ